jgi:hypothetical protein
MAYYDSKLKDNTLSSEALHPVLLKCLPRTNIILFCERMIPHIQRKEGDIAIALSTGTHQTFPLPTAPPKPQRIPPRVDPLTEAAHLLLVQQYEADLENWEITLKPDYLYERESKRRKKDQYDQSNRSVYAILLSYISDESRSRMERDPVTWSKIQLDSDGLALYLYCIKTHSVEPSKRRPQVLAQLDNIRELRQGTQNIERYVNKYQRS